MVFYDINFHLFFYFIQKHRLTGTLNTDFIYPLPEAEPGLNTFWLIFNA